MKSQPKLNNISSNFCLKSIFSYLDYEFILKLIKYNKNLQNKLGLKKENYQNLISYEFATRKIKRKLKLLNNEELNLIIFIIYIITFILFAYILIFSSFLYFKGSFNESNLKNYYDENILNIINKININLFTLDLFLLIAYFVITRFIIKNFYLDQQKIIYFKYVILIVINLFYIFFEVLIIWKIYLSYKIKNDNFPLFMIFDYILLVLLLLHIIFMIFSTYKYYLYAGSGISEFEKIILTKYKNIEINDFELPNNFLNMSKKERIKYIKNNENQFRHSFSQRQKDLMEKINEVRVKNNDPKSLMTIYACYYEDNEKLPNFLIHEISEEKLFEYKNVFKLPNKRILFKYKLNSFEKNLKENKVDLKMLLNWQVNKISITDVGEYEYILLSDDIDALFEFNLDIEEKKNEAIDKMTYDYFIEDSSHID